MSSKTLNGNILIRRKRAADLDPALCVPLGLNVNEGNQIKPNIIKIKNIWYISHHQGAALIDQFKIIMFYPIRPLTVSNFTVITPTSSSRVHPASPPVRGVGGVMCECRCNFQHFQNHKLHNPRTSCCRQPCTARPTPPASPSTLTTTRFELVFWTI